MGICNRRVKKAKEIIALVNKCLDILHEPRLSGAQGVMLIIVIIITALDIGPFKQSFVQKLENVFKMQPGDEQQQALRRLLGMIEVR